MVCLAGAAAFAQSGATYKAKCAMCHGAAGVANPAMVTAMGVKSPNDPAVKSMTVAEMTAVVKNGKGKMKPIAGLTDAQVADAVATFRSFAK
jgi:mono/diheme cytochrome c family protein